MTRAVIAARRASGQPAAAVGAEAIYRKLFDSFGPDKDGRISHWEVLARLQRCGLQPDDPRIAEALTGLKAAVGSSRRIDFGQFQALAQHNGSFSVGALSLGAETDLGVLGFRFEEADTASPYRPAALAGPLDSILAVRQLTSVPVR